MMTLPPGWYAFASPRELSNRKPNALRRFGKNWAVWKTSQGQWVAQSDRCPHRSASLSLGHIQDDCIRCPFHGFRFDSAGKCVHVPEIQRDAPGLKLETHQLVEKHDLLWFAWRDPAKSEIPWFPGLDSGKFTYGFSSHRWAQHFSRCVENQLDYAHLPFVHSNSIGRGFDPAIRATWKFDEKALRVYLGEVTDSSAYFEFRFPNVWQLYISAKLNQTLMFVPVDENETRIYARSYHRFTRIPIIREIIAWVSARVFNPYVLSQDKKIVLSQEPRDVRADHDEQLFPSDRAIQSFRKWLAESV